MLLLLCGDKKTRSQRSLRRYCCQRCAITRCSSVYEAALLDWLIGFYLQKLFGLSPHTIYDEPVVWNDFGCPGWPPFSQDWHGFGLGAGHKKKSCSACSLFAGIGACLSWQTLHAQRFLRGMFHDFSHINEKHTCKQQEWYNDVIGIKDDIQYTIIRMHII